MTSHRQIHASLLPIGVFIVQLLDKLCNRGTGGRIDLIAQFDLQTVVRKGKLIRIEASVPGGSGEFMEVRGRLFTLLNWSNRKL
jgi:hypothetical protein